MNKVRIVAVLLILIGIGIGYFDYSSEKNFESGFVTKLGLDLAGGTELLYRADVSKIDPSEIKGAMDSLRDVIERRTNLFGVSEPLVQVEESSSVAEGEKEHRLIVELPGVTDIDQAISIIGKTPLLEFKTERPAGEKETILKAIEDYKKELEVNNNAPIPSTLVLEDPYFVSSKLTGRFIEKAQVFFDPNTGRPGVSLEFGSEGKDLFAQITKENVGKQLAIYLDNNAISAPVIREEILDGSAVITGDFTVDEAKTVVRDLNYGALPVPIEMISTSLVGASLGKEAFDKGVNAGLWGFLLVAMFLVLWYRLPGILAVVSLMFYVVLMLALFKLIPVTLTAAGVAGFILSIGMAVDANILIFERIREELAKGEETMSAIKDGFSRAWFSIRDSNISSIITAIILFWFGTSLVEGFALVFGLGVIVSMFTAITVTRTLLMAISSSSENKVFRFLLGSGIK